MGSFKRPREFTIGPRLREARLRAGLGLRDAANAIGLRSHSTIHDYEIGMIRVPTDRLHALARAYHVKPSDLLKPVGEQWSERKRGYYLPLRRLRRTDRLREGETKLARASLPLVN